MAIDRYAPEVPTLAPELIEQAERYARQARADNTTTTYESQANVFGRWCRAQGVSALPVTPQLLAAWISSRAAGGASVSTIAVGIAAVVRANRMAGNPDPREHPVFQEVWAGVVRAVETTPRRQARPIEPELLRRIAERAELEGTLPWLRARALLLLMFAAALRRSEAVALEVDDLERDQRGFRLCVRRSKTDRGAKDVPIAAGEDAADPERAVRSWLEAAGIEHGPVFRAIRRGRVGRAPLRPRAVERVVAFAVAGVGADPAPYGGHSMRAGFATSAAEKGATLERIARHGRWKRLDTVMRYIRPVELHKNNPAEGLL